jgi:Protein of unknown function (DUF3710)
MALRRRGRRTERSKIDATPPWDSRIRDEPAPTSGPFDIRDEPEDDLTRVDLGALRVPVWPGVELRLDVTEAQQVVSVTLVAITGTMQLAVFAAPRNEGIWADVRTEMRTSLAASGGSVKERPDGPFGTELVGRVRGAAGQMPIRILGIDGPRWFFRATLTGPAATERVAAEPFERALRNLVVVRGSDPLPVREAVPLRMPKEATTQSDSEESSNGAGPAPT